MAEAKFMEADLELRLEELEQAKQRQVIMQRFLTSCLKNCVVRALSEDGLRQTTWATQKQKRIGVPDTYEYMQR
jgi:hypothetical protein